MFFEIWAKEFISKMKEERKKQRAEAKKKREERKRIQSEHKRKEKQVEVIIPKWVSLFKLV